MATSSAVSAGDLATADQYNNLRTDVLSTHDHDGTDGTATLAATTFSANATFSGTIASGAITSSGVIKTDSTTEATSTTDGSLQTDGGLSVVKDAVFGDDVKLLSDSSVLAFGADGDTTLTHTDGTGLTLNSTNKLTFGDTGTFIHQSSDGVLTITSDTTVDINGAVVFDGAITGATNITLSGELDAATLDVSGNADIDGTLEADAYTVDGTTLAEYIADTAGAMFSSNTETGIAATYQDGDNTIDLAISAAQTTITSLFATDIKIGEDDQTKIDFEDANTINFYANNAKEVVLAENSISPGTSDGTALGTTSLMWSDLFLASGSVINFNNGDITLTHSSNTLTAAGGTVATAALTTSTIVASGIVKTDDTTNATSTTDGSLQTDGGLSVVLDAVFGDDVKLLSDSAVLAFGADGDATLTHTNDTGITLNSTNKLMFNDATQFVQGSSGTVLSIGATDEIDLTATAVDLNGTLDVSGNATFNGTVALGTQSLTFSDITLSRGAANRLDIASGDSLKLVAGDITVTDGSIQFQAGDGRLKGDGGANDSLGWTSGDGYFQSRQHLYLSVDGAAAHGAGSDKVIIETGGVDGAGSTVMYFDDGGGITVYTNTAVPGTVSGAASLYTVGSGGSAEMTVKDGSGNTTTLSPHNNDNGEWWFNSKNAITGRVFKVHMEKLVKFIDKQFGTDFVEEYMEEADE